MKEIKPGSIIYTNPPVEIRGEMTLRDYFAAKALQGLVNDEIESETRAAEWCYRMADAMLKARIS